MFQALITLFLAQMFGSHPHKNTWESSDLIMDPHLFDHVNEKPWRLKHTPQKGVSSGVKFLRFQIPKSVLARNIRTIIFLRLEGGGQWTNSPFSHVRTHTT